MPPFGLNGCRLYPKSDVMADLPLKMGGFEMTNHPDEARR